MSERMQRARALIEQRQREITTEGSASEDEARHLSALVVWGFGEPETTTP